MLATKRGFVLLGDSVPAFTLARVSRPLDLTSRRAVDGADWTPISDRHDLVTDKESWRNDVAFDGAQRRWD